jgi:hypothetical protein
MNGRTWLGCGALTVLMLAPCFWLPQIQSADLSSHLYNAWLTTLVERSELDGLYLAPQLTNFLFDWLLAKLLPAVGKAAAGRIAVSLCVLVLFTGGLALCYAAIKRIPWHVAGSLAMLCYGFVYHMGLFNFYLSLGFCVWGLAIIWSRAYKSWILAIPFLVGAFIAHPFPVLWFLAVAGFLAAARRLGPNHRFWLVVGCVFFLLGLRLAVQLTLSSFWEPRQLLLTSGADQAMVFDTRYVWIAVLWAVWWIYLAAALIVGDGWTTVRSSLPFLLVCLHALGIFLIPTRILPPGYTTAFVLIAERMSLPQGILVCLLLAHLPSSLWRVSVHAALTVAFFIMMYQSESKLAALESLVERAVMQLPRGSRVLSGLCWPESRFNGAYHLLDRACIGHCFSYGNFEPASGQFRLRSQPGNRFVVANIGQSYAYEYEEFLYRPEDVAEFRVAGVVGSEPKIQKLEPGVRVLPPCPSSPETR